jgi:anti-sigma factor RsiW
MDSYLSGELLVESNHFVLRHIATCDACRAEADRREQMRMLLRQAIGMPMDTETVRVRINHVLDGQWGQRFSVARYWAQLVRILEQRDVDE